MIKDKNLTIVYNSDRISIVCQKSKRS